MREIEASSSIRVSDDEYSLLAKKLNEEERWSSALTPNSFNSSPSTLILDGGYFEDISLDKLTRSRQNTNTLPPCRISGEKPKLAGNRAGEDQRVDPLKISYAKESHASQTRAKQVSEHHKETCRCVMF